MFQQVTLVGNLGRDPEMRWTPSGIAVTNLSVAVTETWNKDGERQEKTLWIKVTVWRKLAETVSEFLHKGSKILVIGRLEEPESWTGDDGTVRVNLKVTADTIKFLSPRSEGGESYQRPTGNQRQAQGAPQQEERAYTDEDIPF